MNGRPAAETVGSPNHTGATGTADLTGTAMPRTAFTFAADGSYAACLTRTAGGAWYPERWTLAGPEPYTVPLPGAEPEVPGATALLPLPDGRVLVCRRGEGGHRLALLYPAGPSTAELPVGTLDVDEVRLLALPSPTPRAAHAAWHAGPALALAIGCGRPAADDDGGTVTSVWLVSSATGPDPDERPEPRRLAALPGRHLGGIWLDRNGRLLALDRVGEKCTRTVVLDLDSGATSPLLQIAEDSNDRLVLADPDSGLLVVRSDAPGTDRVGWGVLGSARPIRFPECLGVPGASVIPFAVQPGAPLTPEHCGVAVRIEDPGGSRLAVWRPAERVLGELVPPDGWFLDAGHWSADGLRLPYAHGGCPFGVALLSWGSAESAESAESVGSAVPAGPADTVTSEPAPVPRPADTAEPSPESAVTEPAATEPAATEAATTEPAATQPAITEPPLARPTATEPAMTEGTATQPAPPTQPAGAETTAASPTVTEPAATEPLAAQPPAAQPPDAAATTDTPRGEAYSRETPKPPPVEPGSPPPEQPERVTPDQVTSPPEPREPEADTGVPTTTDPTSPPSRAAAGGRPGSTPPTSGNTAARVPVSRPPLRTPVPLQQAPLASTEA